MKTRAPLTMLIVTAIVFLVYTAATHAKGVEKKVVFKPGSMSQVIDGCVIRGDRDTYTVNAREKQFMSILISSVENNAVFYIMDSTTGKTLKGAEEETEAKRWQGYLPSSGDYRVIVGGTRGNADYILKIEIRNPAK